MVKNLKKCLERAFVIFVCISFVVVNPHFNNVAIAYALPSTLLVNGTSVNVRSGPGTTYSILGTVPLGYKFKPTESLDDVSGNGRYWYRFKYNNQNGYIRSDYTKETIAYIYDAAFEAELNIKGFPESYKEGLRDLHANYPNWTFTLQKTGLDFNYVLENELIGTKTLVKSSSISSYKSTDTGKYDWTTSTWPSFDGSTWVAASREITAAYLDPRNFLSAPYIFQFEHQTFNVDFHTVSGIAEMVKGTFLDSKVTTEGLSGAIAGSQTLTPTEPVFPYTPSNDATIIYPGNEITPYNPSVPVIPMLMNDADNKVYGFSNVYYPSSDIESLGPAAGIINDQYNGQSRIINQSSNNSTTENQSYAFTYLPAGTYSYAELIYDACRQVNVNPYVIVAMILQEQGKDGSNSVSGTYEKYKGFYNFGNINAYAGNGNTPVENGLIYASGTGSYNRPWNTKEKGIYGLCDFYANRYVHTGQDTFYLKKWNVQGENLFKHQYMTNVAGAAAEGKNLANAYDDIMVQLPHEFKIPCYENMSETPCEMPTRDGSPNNKLKNLFVANYYLTPTFDPDVSNYSIIVDSNVNQVFINAEAYDKKAAIGGVGNISTLTSYTDAIIYCAAENGDIRQYTISIYKKGAENVAATDIYSGLSPTIYPNQINIDQNVAITNNNISNINNNSISNNSISGQFSGISNAEVRIGVAPGQ